MIHTESKAVVTCWPKSRSLLRPRIYESWKSCEMLHIKDCCGLLAKVKVTSVLWYRLRGFLSQWVVPDWFIGFVEPKPRPRWFQRKRWETHGMRTARWSTQLV